MALTLSLNKANKSKKRRGCLLLVLIFIGLFLWYNSAMTKLEKQNRHRAYIAALLKDGIEQYYKKQGRYPEDTASLLLQHQQTVEEFLQNSILNYATDPSGKKWFAITCRYAGIFSSGEKKYSMSW